MLPCIHDLTSGFVNLQEVKLSAADIIKNLHKDGKPLIPPGSFVYISTDDTKGVCKGCMVNRILCPQHPTPKPPGCPEDPSWKAFTEFGWTVRFLDNYLEKGYLKDSNPNVHGMIESIVCSRSKVFAGTWFSTFTGYIHRLRGYHGLGEATYFHTTGKVFAPQNPVSMGHGWSREWRYGWTDDEGGLI